MKLTLPTFVVGILIGSLWLIASPAAAQDPNTYPNASTSAGASGLAPNGYFNTQAPVPTQGPPLGSPNPTAVVFGAEWLFVNRTHALSAPTSIIGGPDAFSFKSTPFNYTSGYRLRFGVESLEGWGLDAIYNDFGGWNQSRTGTLSAGVGFDNGILAGGPWAGANFINGSTYFTPISAASQVAIPSGPNTSAEFHGFGPNVAFPLDTPPTFSTTYQSHIWTLEANTLNYEWGGLVQYGFGYAHAQVTENASTSITGLLRAPDAAGGALGGLGNDALTSPFAGNLGLISGAANGFDDESGVTGQPGPDTLTFLHQASTQNYLNGGQGVLKLIGYDGPSMLLNFTGKAGVFHNRATGVITERYSGSITDNSVYGRSFTNTRDAVAFMGNTGLGGAYKVTPNFRITGGYDVWFFSGMALASEQLKGINGSAYQVQTNGSFIAHGSRLGLDWRY